MGSSLVSFPILFSYPIVRDLSGSAGQSAVERARSSPKKRDSLNSRISRAVFYLNLAIQFYLLGLFPYLSKVNVWWDSWDRMTWETWGEREIKPKASISGWNLPVEPCRNPSSLSRSLSASRFSQLRCHALRMPLENKRNPQSAWRASSASPALMARLLVYTCCSPDRNLA